MALLALLAEPTRAQEPRGPSPLGQYFGFLPVEIFKLERRSSNLLARDLDRDGLVDLVVADNSHSRIDYLRQRKQKPAAAAADFDEDTNQVKNDWRFEHRKIPVDRQVAALVAGDFNGDGRSDLAYLGTPNYLVVRFQPKEGEWSEKLEFRIPDINPIRGSLVTGDMDGNGRPDLVVLGKFETFIYYQSKDGKLGTPRLLMNTSAQLGLAIVGDLDGDGRDDLCYATVESQKRSFCARLQDKTGRLGPEVRFELPAHRDVQLQDIDGRRGRELVVVESSTNRVKLLKIHGPAGDGDGPKPKQRLIQYGFGRQGAARTEQLRDVATGDVDGDGRTDVLVTDPAGARVIVFRQRPTGGLDLGTAFPGLEDTRHVKIGNVDGAAGNEVVVVSVKEKTLGISQMAKGRLGFPKPLTVMGSPVACELVNLDGKPGPEIVYVAKPAGGRGYVLGALAKGKNGQFSARSFGKLAQVPVPVKGTPQYLVTVDANLDGRPDLLVFQDLEQPPVLMIGQADGGMKAVSGSGGIQLGGIDPGQLFVGRLEKQSILVAQQKFARNLALTPSGGWQVIDQYNVTESNAKIAGVAALDLDETPGKEIVLVDTGVRQLRMMRREGEGKLFRPWREVELGTLAYRTNRIADLDGDKREDLLLVGNGKFAVLYNGRTGPRLKELASFEPRRKQAVFSTTVSGDLNGDGRVDVAAIDKRSHRISLLDHSPARGLRHALDFRVFEQKSFRGAAGGGAGSEPREVLIADVTGDDRLDLVLLVHDRVLVYPQDAGDPAKAKPGKQKAK
ncbi:MAG TPA: hypothetical protein DER64_15655 [Planctomycetaceae bacterium]|nr:hypothetical protein [Planctomycetaceae bacterium]